MAKPSIVAKLNQRGPVLKHVMSETIRGSRDSRASSKDWALNQVILKRVLLSIGNSDPSEQAIFLSTAVTAAVTTTTQKLDDRLPIRVHSLRLGVGEFPSANTPDVNEDCHPRWAACPGDHIVVFHR